MPESPLVSIIMNCYNGEQYLREALDSVLSQTYQDWELIFWDNQSTDHSKDIFKSHDDERLKYFYAPKHTLLYEARNYAIEKASGEFYAFLDVDDWWIPEKSEKQIPLFNDQNVGLVYGNYWLVDTIKGTKTLKSKEIMPVGYIQDELLKKYIVGMLTIIIRKELISKEEYFFNPLFNIIGDFDMVIRVAGTNKISALQEPIAFFRWHNNNTSKLDSKRWAQELSQWCKEAREKHNISIARLWNVCLLVLRLKIREIIKLIYVK